MSIEISNGFILSKSRAIPEAQSKIYEYMHAKTKARLIFVENEDNNKSFTIGFKTIPADSTGVAHIIEHSILCGSEKYNVKQPMIELIKGSLATFVNAITFPSMTIYPVASQNEEDLLNLSKVYLDSVFNPNLKKNPEIFMQEGWHYEIKDGELVRNGVVYNEMKGAFSNPMRTLHAKTSELLFDNCYHHVSGGHPDVIPELTYDKFLSFYNKYYHPTNSCSVLYGNVDIEQFLPLLNEYFSQYEYSEDDYSIVPTTVFNTPKYGEFTYSINENQSEEKNSYLKISYLIDRTHDRSVSLAFNILGRALIDSEASPIKSELLKRGLCSSIYSDYDDYKVQSTFSIVVSNINAEDKDEIIKIINEGILNAAQYGIDSEIMEATISNKEFELKEITGIPCIEKAECILRLWTCDPDLAVEGLSYEKDLSNIKKYYNHNGFKEFIKDSLIRNQTRVTVLLKPEKGLAAKKLQAEKENLRKYKENLSEKELLKIEEDFERVKKRQAYVDTPEQLKSIPVLKVSDIEKTNKSMPYFRKNIMGIDSITYYSYTNSIIYQNFKFKSDFFNEDEVKYLSLMSYLLGLMDTKNYNCQILDKEISSTLGGLNINTNAFTDMNNLEISHRYFNIEFKFLDFKVKKAADLISEIIFKTKFDNKDRLYQLIQTIKNNMERSMLSSGDSVAQKRMNSMLTVSGIYNELAGGISFYEFLVNLCDNFSEKSDEIINSLNNIKNRLFVKNGLIVSSVCEEENTEIIENTISEIGEYLILAGDKKPYALKLNEEKSEAISTTSNVQYVGKGYNFKKLGYSYNGALAVLKTMLYTDFLWNKVRVSGGAYGCFSIIDQDGSLLLCSYRDPQLRKTLEAYTLIPQYIENLKNDDFALNKYILGTVKNLDYPLLPESAGHVVTKNYITHNTDEMRQKIRDDILSVTYDDIKKYADLFSKAQDKNVSVTFGNAHVISENKEIFDNIIYI